MKKKMLSIVIPCYNEGVRVYKNIEKVEDYLRSLMDETDLKEYVEDYEVIVISDGAKDNTAEEILRYKGERVIPIVNEINRGKGYVVRQGFEIAKGEFVLFMDADLATDLSAIRKVVKTLCSNPYSAVIGSRNHRQTTIVGGSPWYRRIMSLSVNRLSQLLLPIGHVQDTQCGFKGYSYVYSKLIAEMQKMERFSFDLEHLIIVRKNGGTITEIPVHYYKQETTTVRPIKDSIRFFKDVLMIRKHLRANQYKKTYKRKDIQ